MDEQRGDGMNSEDDPRSIDWAPNKINDLEKKTTFLGDRLTEETHRLRCMIRDLSKQSGDGIRDLSQRLDSEETTRVWARHARITERITALENQSRLIGTGSLVDEIMDRLAALEAGVKSLSHQGNEDRGRINELQAAIVDRVRSAVSAGLREFEPDEDKIPQFGAPWSVDEFSPPIGQAQDMPFSAEGQHVCSPDCTRGHGPVKRKTDTEDRGTGTPARHGGVVPYEGPFPSGSIADISEKSWGRGYEAGRRAAIDEAESRVRAYMENHFSTGTINGVLNEINAVVSTKPADDMPIQLELAEERVVAKCVEMGWHRNSPATLGMVNALRGTKPIKDQPQG